MKKRGKVTILVIGIIAVFILLAIVYPLPGIYSVKSHKSCADKGNNYCKEFGFGTIDPEPEFARANQIYGRLCPPIPNEVTCTVRKDEPFILMEIGFSPFMGGCFFQDIMYDEASFEELDSIIAQDLVGLVLLTGKEYLRFRPKATGKYYIYTFGSCDYNERYVLEVIE